MIFLLSLVLQTHLPLDIMIFCKPIVANNKVVAKNVTYQFRYCILDSIIELHFDRNFCLKSRYPRTISNPFSSVSFIGLVVEIGFRLKFEIEKANTLHYFNVILSDQLEQAVD